MYKRARMGIGYLAQETSVFKKLTVEQNIRAILQMRRMSRKEQSKRLEFAVGRRTAAGRNYPGAGLGTAVYSAR